VQPVDLDRAFVERLAWFVGQPDHHAVLPHHHQLWMPHVIAAAVGKYEPEWLERLPLNRVTEFFRAHRSAS
jgi:hypothetical protein